MTHMTNDNFELFKEEEDTAAMTQQASAPPADRIEAAGQNFLRLLSDLGHNWEFEQARLRIEEAIMWAERGARTTR